MLDSFTILTTSGVVLWSKKYAPIPQATALINSLITDVFIEEKNTGASDTKTFKKDAYTLKWRVGNIDDLGLIFIAVYQSLLQLTWIDDLLESVKKLFITLYGERIKNEKVGNGVSGIVCHFEDYFESRVRDLEGRAGSSVRINGTSERSGELTEQAPSTKNGMLSLPPPMPLPFGLSNTLDKRAGSPNNLLPPKARLRGGRTGRNNRASSPYVSSGEENIPKKKKGGKKLRKWAADGMEYVDDGEDSMLDYSTHGPATTSGGSSDDEGHANIIGNENGSATVPKLEQVYQEEWGRKTAKGEFILKDVDEEVHALLRKADNNQENHKSLNGAATASNGIASSAFDFFKSFVGGKVLTKADLEKPMASMLDHLLKKNVAREAALQLCSSVEASLIGQRTGSFQSIEALIKSSMEASLRKILTPTTSLDLLRAISTKKSQGSRPYVISIVGVNGVGKSTNLSKICFFLLQNKLKVLVAACDTFRSGAVEQLRVHVRNLKELSSREGEGSHVGLYEKGYGKDAANIAKDAVSYGESQGYDVVLIDTAGRRHNDTRLMSSLEKFAKLAQPDKILMVGEALVGTDSVQQARNFNAAFGNGRGLDGFIISKCDTVGDMIGTLVSMVFATGIPVVFLGVGQNYQDLRTLNEGWAVRLLMQ